MWLKSHSELRDHPKVRKAARLLKTSVPAIVGHLHMLWWWCLSYAQDGVISDYDTEEIADAVMFDGDPNEFIETLISCRLLDRDDNGVICIHDWEEHCGQTLEKRERDAERKRNARSNLDTRTTSAECPSDVQNLSAGRPLDVIRPSGVRGEERRGEEKREREGAEPRALTHNSGKPQAKPKPKPADKAPPFVIPTVAEISAYCRERANTVDAQRFFDYHEAKGWLVGNVLMADWRAVVRNWERLEAPPRKNAPSAHEKKSSPNSGSPKIPNAPPGFDLKKYCMTPDGKIDGVLYDNTLRALHGNPNFAKFMPDFEKLKGEVIT